MNKTIVKVFIILGILVLALLIWAFVFGNGLSTIFNAVIDPINGIYWSITGDKTHSQSLIPRWDVSNKNTLSGASSAAAFK